MSADPVLCAAQAHVVASRPLFCNKVDGHRGEHFAEWLGAVWNDAGELVGRFEGKAIWSENSRLRDLSREEMSA